jgi:hypothetical protein
MNQGLLRENSAPDRFSPDNYFTGYWGPSRQLSGVENPGEQSLVTVTFEVTVPQVNQANLEHQTAWAVLANEVPFDVEAFELHPRVTLAVSASSMPWSLDVAYGAVGHETIILDRFLLGGRNAATSGGGVADVIGPFPVRIPAGSRVVARLTQYANANSGTAAAWQVQPFFYRRYPRPGTKGVTLPLGTPNLAARLTNPGGADVDSTYRDIGTTPFDTHWVLPCPIVGSSNNTHGTGIMVFDWAYVDGAGSDIVIVDNYQFETNVAEWVWCQPRPIPVNLPAGTLIRCRGKYDSATSGTATLMVGGITCIGVEDVDPARRPGQSQIVG